MSKIKAIAELISDAHVMGLDGLRDYHTAAKVRDAGRIRDAFKRFQVIKSALHPYRVTVTWSGAGDVLVRRNDTNQSMVL